MGDVYCKKCGEPWDYYGLRHGDVEPGEGRRILRGEGCPCCDWGNDKTRCDSHDSKYYGSLMELEEDAVEYLELG